MFPVTAKAAAVSSYSALKLFPLIFSHCSHVQVLPARVSRRCMAAAARVRSEEEKKSRKAAREELTVAHKQYPFLPTKATKQVYVLDKELADEIANVVIKNRSDPASPVLETNPGPGVLTKALLAAGTKRMVLVESTKGFMPYLQEVQKENKRRIRALYNMDYLRSWRRVGEADHVSTEFENRLPALFPHRAWTEGPPVSVIITIPQEKEQSFLNQLIQALGRQNSLFSLGRPELFLAVSPSLYMKLLVAEMEEPAASAYSHLAIALRLVFDIRLLAQTKQKKPEVSNSMRYLLRFCPHADQPLAHADVPVFLSFVAQLMRKKKARIIPKMEQLVPGCGPHLIKLDVTMMSLIIDMSPVHFLTIFKAMQTWPEYQGSPLKQLLASSAVLTAEVDSAEDSHKDSREETETEKTGKTAGQTQEDS